MRALAFAAVVASCAWSGTRDAILHAHDAVIAEDCAWRRCRAEIPEVRSLGDGCYVVDATRLYQCRNDIEPVGGVTCVRDYMSSGITTQLRSLFSFPRDITPDGRCREKYNATLPPTRRCHAVTVEAIGSRRAMLDFGDEALLEVQRSGKSRLVVAIEPCGARVVRTSGFSAVDRGVIAWLARELEPLACGRVTVRVDVRDSC